MNNVETVVEKTEPVYDSKIGAEKTEPVYVNVYNKDFLELADMKAEQSRRFHNLMNTTPDVVFGS